jgi:hypothetical protein
VPTPEQHAAARQRVVTATAAVAADRWAQVDPAAIARSWTAQLPTLTAAVSAAQFSVADAAEDYLDEFAPLADVEVDPAGFAGRASDGGNLASLLYQPAITALMSIGSGAGVDRALAGGRANLDMIVRTQVADAGRGADQAALTARPQVQGYVRQIVGATCSRCVILAGRFYRWNAGFQRHPRCDCIHVPANRAQWRETGRFHDPQQVYDSLSTAQRQRAGWSLADQKAIAEGADLTFTTNMKGVTSAGTRRSAGKLTPDQIYKRAGNNRDEAIRLLRQNGYLRGSPVVRTVRSDLTLAARSAASRSETLALEADVGFALVESSGVAIRSGLKSATTIDRVEAYLKNELRFFTGNDVSVYMTGFSPATAREYAEGILRCVDLFPKVELEFVTRLGADALVTDYAQAGGGRIFFNRHWSSPEQRSQLLRNLEREAKTGWSVKNSGNPMAVAIHEFGHLLDIDTLGQAILPRVHKLVAARAKAAGISPDALIKREVSEYAASKDEELVAEAFMDFAINRREASELSRDIFDLLQAEYRKRFGG